MPLNSAGSVSHACLDLPLSLTHHTASPSTARDMTSTQVTAGAAKEEHNSTKTPALPTTAGPIETPTRHHPSAKFVMRATNSTKTPCAKSKTVQYPTLTLPAEVVTKASHCNQMVSAKISPALQVLSSRIPNVCLPIARITTPILMAVRSVSLASSRRENSVLPKVAADTTPVQNA